VKDGLILWWYDQMAAVSESYADYKAIVRYGLNLIARIDGKIPKGDGNAIKAWQRRGVTKH